MSKPSRESFAAEAAAIAKEIKAEEERARKMALSIEQKKKAFLERGHKYFADLLSGYRGQAVSIMVEARDAVGKIGPAPCQPQVRGTPEEYLAACESHDSALASHGHNVRHASKRIHRQLRALWAQASAARLECRSLGMTCPEGIAYVDEYVRNNTRHHNAVNEFGVGMGHESAVYDVATLDRLIAALTEPKPEVQAPNPTYLGGVAHEPNRDGNWVSRGWSRLSEALSDDPPAKPLQTQQQRDAEAYIARVGAGTQLPIGERKLDPIFRDDGK